jgi:hypothetical protein
VQGIPGHKFPQFQEICYTAGFLEFLIQCLAAAGNRNILPKLGAELREEPQGLPEAFFISLHAHKVPHDYPEFPVKFGHRFSAFY